MPERFCLFLMFFTWIPIQAQPDPIPSPAQQWETKGQTFQSQGRYDSAAHYFQLALISYEAAADTLGIFRSKKYLGNARFRMGDFAGTQDYLSAAITEAKQMLGPQHPLVADMLNLLAGASTYLGNDELGRELLQEELSIRQALEGPTSASVASIYNGLMVICQGRGEMTQGIEYGLKALAILRALNEARSSSAAGIYDNLGICYTYQGDTDIALNYLAQALAINQSLYGKQHPKVARTYANLARTYQKKEDLERAIADFRKALVINQATLGPQSPFVGQNLYELAMVLRQDARYESALARAKEAEAILLNSLGPEHPAMGDVYFTLGNIYTYMDQFVEADRYQARSRAIYEQSFDPRNIIFAQWHLARGRKWLRQSDYTEALRHFQQALQVFDPAVELSPASQPGLQPRLTRFLMLEILSDKANALRLQAQSIADLRLAHETYALLDTLLQQIRAQVQGSGAKEQIVKWAYQDYERAVQVALELQEKSGEAAYGDAAFRYTELSRSVLLLESLRESRARQFAGVPASVLDREQALQRKKARLENQLFAASHEGGQADSIQIASWNQQLYSLRQSLDSLLRSLQSDYPAYYQLKYNPRRASQAEVQGFLQPEEALLSYMEGPDFWTVFVLTAKHRYSYRLPKSEDFTQQIGALRNSLTRPQAERDSLGLLSHALYEQLLAKPLAALGPAVTQLRIIPSGKLSYVPFEILLSDAPADRVYQHWPYILRRFRISYAYSVTWWLEASQTDRAAYTFGGFSPEYESLPESTPLVATGDSMWLRLREGELNLPGAQKEVAQIARLTQGKAYLGADAKESHFKAEAEDFGILHLAMHAQVSDETPLYSYLLFTPDSDSLEDDLLTAAELYNQKLQAQLAVLSACNTGFGSLSRGEGIMSLSRAFSFAGCPSVVMSLWQVSDQSTADLMLQFYVHLKAGLPKDEALRQAKLAYLDKQVATELSHPFFWAGFIPTGDMRPLQWTPAWRPWVWGLGGGVVVVLMGFILYRYLRKPRRGSKFDV